MSFRTLVTLGLIALTLLAPTTLAEEIRVVECGLIGGGGVCLANRDIISVGNHLIENDIIICADVFVGCAEE